MSNVTINTNIIGTYNLSYTARDESNNISNKKRNLFILPNFITPTINLKPSILGMTRELASAVKPGSLLEFVDRGYIATDAYGNSSEDFPLIKQKVTTEHRRHSNKDDDEGTLIYSETNGIITLPEGVEDNGPITLKLKPKYLYLFNNGVSTPFYNSNWTPSNSDPQTVYFTVTYILSLPGHNPVSTTRKIYISDLGPPSITLATVSNPQYVEAGSNFTDTSTFNILENYWYIDNETSIPDGYSAGFSLPDGNNDPNGSIQIKDPSGQVQSSINTTTLGTWKITYTFYCLYTSDSSNISAANFVPYVIPIGDAISDPVNKTYILERDVIVRDTTPPTVDLKQIASESNPLTFGDSLNVNDRGRLYTKDDNTNGSNYNMYFWVPKNSSTKPSLQDVLPNVHVVGTYGSSTIPSGDAEIIIRDNAGSQQNFTVVVTIVTPPNISLPSGHPNILRTSIGTDFNDSVDYNIYPIAGTENNPAEYTIIYDVRDAQNNLTRISRRLYIIDRTIPNITFSSFDNLVPSFTTTNNGLVYGKGTSTVGQTNNTRLLFASDVTETSYQDEFGDIVSKKVSYTTNPLTFVQGYRKDRPQNVFLVSYNTTSNRYQLKTFYNKNFVPSGENSDNPIRIAVEEKEYQQVNFSVNNKYTVYYFDMSHTSLSGRNKIRFVPSGGFGLGVTDTYVESYELTPPGTYHSYFSQNFYNANSDAGLNDGNEIFIEEYVNGSWQPASTNALHNDIELVTYNPNSGGDDGLDDGWTLI